MKIVHRIILSAGAAAVMPFLLLCYYTVPGYIDDYGIALDIRNHGIGFVTHYLKTWNGRFVAAFFHWLNPLGYDLSEWYGLTALFLLIFFATSLRIFVGQITRNFLSPTEQQTAWIALLTFFLAYVRSSVDLFYWYSSGATYCVAICWQLLYLSLLPKLFNQNANKSPLVLLVLFAFLQAGTNEAVSVPAFILTAALTAVLIGQKNRRWHWAVLILIAFLLGIALQIVLSDAPRSRATLHLQFQRELVMRGVKVHWSYVFGWFRNAPLFVAFFLLLPLMSHRNGKNRIFAFSNMQSILFPAVIGALGITGVFAAYCIFNRDSYIPKRIENIAFLWWLLTVGATLFALVRYLRFRYNFLFEKIPDYLTVALIFFIVFKIFSANTKVGLAWKVLLNGDARAYRSAYEQRRALMLYHRAIQYQDTVFLPPVSPRLELLFHKDLPGYLPDNRNNEAFAAYFGLKAVKLSSP